MSPDKVGAGLFKVSYFIGKFLGLVALDYDFKNKVFLTSIRATAISGVICVFVALMSPLVVKWNSEIYFVSGVDIDESFSLITSAQFAFGFATSFVVLLCQLWKRHQISRTANDFRKVFEQLEFEMGGRGCIVTPEVILLVVMKFSITMYEVLVNFPYVIQYADTITLGHFVAFLLNLYIAEIAAVFSDITFAALILLERYLCLLGELLEALRVDMESGGRSEWSVYEYRRRLVRLIRLYLRIRRMVEEFARCVEVAILVQMLNSFTNMLANLYALLDFYVLEKNFEKKEVVYNVMIFVNICLLIHAAEKVRRGSARLRDAFLDLDASGPSGWRSDVLVFKLWPEVFQVHILGMFPLNNTFLLFLISYASNFVVIILQCEMTKIL